MFKFGGVISLFVVFQIINCHVIRDVSHASSSASASATSQSNIPTPFTDLALQAEHAVNSFHTQFLDTFKVQNNDELFNLFQQQSKQYVDKIGGLIGQLQEESKHNTGVLDSMFGGVTTQLNAAIDELKVKNPEFMNQASAYEEYFKTNVQRVLEETNKLSEKLKTDGVSVSNTFENAVKKIYDDTLKTAKDVQTQITTTIQQQQQPHN